MGAARRERAEHVRERRIDQAAQRGRVRAEGDLQPAADRWREPCGLVRGELEHRNIGASQDTGSEGEHVASEHRADPARRLDVCRARGRPATPSRVVGIPGEPGNLATHGGGVRRRQWIAPVRVGAIGERDHLTGHSGLIRPVVGGGDLSEGRALHRGGGGHGQLVERDVVVHGAGHGQCPHGIAGRSGRVGEVAVVARGDHREHTVLGQVVDDEVLRIVDRGVVGAEREVDDIEVVGEVSVAVRVECPVQGRDHRLGVARAAEHLECVDRRSRRHPRWDLQRVERGGVQPLVAAGERAAAGVHAVPGGDSGHMAAVPLAVDRVRVGMGHRLVVARRWVGVIGVADEVVASGDLRRGQRREARLPVRVGAVGVGGVPGVSRSRPAEIGVRVVDSGVDDADAHPLTDVAGVLPRREHLRELGAVRAERMLAHDRVDLDHIGPLGDRLDGRHIGVDGHAGDRVADLEELGRLAVDGLRPVEHVPGRRPRRATRGFRSGDLGRSGLAGGLGIGRGVRRARPRQLDENADPPGLPGEIRREAQAGGRRGQRHASRGSDRRRLSGVRGSGGRNSRARRSRAGRRCGPGRCGSDGHRKTDGHDGHQCERTGASARA